jgi:hypothetical protein
MRLTYLSSRVFRLVAIGILAGLLPTTVVPSELDVACPVEPVPVDDPVITTSVPNAVRPCPTEPPSTVVRGAICDPRYTASCRDEPCRCWVGTFCFRRNGVHICITGTICQEFISNRVRRPQCRPAQLSSRCVLTPRVCGQFIVYLGNCGGPILHSFDGWMLACG